MSLLFIDSFDHYSGTQGTRKWTSGGLGGPEFTLVAGRNGYGARVGTFAGMSKTFKGNGHNALAMGMAYSSDFAQAGGMAFRDVASGISAGCGNIGDGRFRFDFGIATGSVSGSLISDFVMHTSRWYYFEMLATVAVVVTNPETGAGTVTFTGEFWVNEEQVLVDSAVFTLTSGISRYVGFGFSTVAPGGPGGGNQATIDDVYVTDGERLGDVRIAVLYPNATGDLAMWDPSDGVSANWSLTEEHPADDDTTYVSTGTVNDADLYNLDDIGAGFVGTIKGAQALWLVKKSDNGLAAVKGQWKSAGLTEEQVKAFYPSHLSWLYNIQAERKSLFTLGDWTVSEINALQLGIKRTL